MGAVGECNKGTQPGGIWDGGREKPRAGGGLRGRQQEPDGRQPGRPPHGSWSEEGDPEAPSPRHLAWTLFSYWTPSSEAKIPRGAGPHCSILFAFTVPVSLV